MKFINIIALATLCQSAYSFNFLEMESKRKTTQLSALTEGDSRRDFFTKAGSAAFAASAGLGLDLLGPLPANAVGLDQVNAKLKAYGLPLSPKPANGLTPLLEIYGKGKNRFPLLVKMDHPITWVVTLPSNDVNAEDGTVQAGEYAKGDTATFFVYEEPGHVDVSMIVKEELSELGFALIYFGLTLGKNAVFKKILRTLPALERNSMKRHLSRPFHRKEPISTKISKLLRLLPRILPITMERNMLFAISNTHY